MRRARLRAVGVGLHQRPACGLDALPAQPHLVLDRGLALPVGGIAGIDRGAGHGRLLRGGAPRTSASMALIRALAARWLARM